MSGYGAYLRLPEQVEKSYRYSLLSLEGSQLFWDGITDIFVPLSKSGHASFFSRIALPEDDRKGAFDQNVMILNADLGGKEKLEAFMRKAYLFFNEKAKKDKQKFSLGFAHMAQDVSEESVGAIRNGVAFNRVSHQICSGFNFPSQGMNRLLLAMPREWSFAQGWEHFEAVFNGAIKPHNTTIELGADEGTDQWEWGARQPESFEVIDENTSAPKETLEY